MGTSQLLSGMLFASEELLMTDSSALAVFGRPRELYSLLSNLANRREMLKKNNGGREIIGLR